MLWKAQIMHEDTHLKKEAAASFKMLVATCMMPGVEDTWAECVSPHMTKLGLYRGADKSLARPTSPCILFDGEIISFGASLILYI
jgi:hypothetical protein